MSPSASARTLSLSLSLFAFALACNGGSEDSTATATDTNVTETSSATGGEDTIYARLGGYSGITTLVTDFVGIVLGDDRINAYFLNTEVDGANLIKCLSDQVAAATGGPETYGCKDMKSAHTGMGISTLDFGDLAEDFSKALDAHQSANAPMLTDADKMTILGVLGDMAPDIVEDADNNATVYQRLGRKPGVSGAVGDPGSAGTFVANVAADTTLVGFFAGSDFDRLNTCLTRQLSSIDGPAVYGAEVDAPAGIDPGVGADKPCLDMVTSHAGLTNAETSMMITVDDFAALAAHLVNTLSDAGVAQADIDAIVGVLGPMCADIIANPADCP